LGQSIPGTTGWGVVGYGGSGVFGAATSASGIGVYGLSNGSGAAATGYTGYTMPSGNMMAGVSGRNTSSGYGVWGSSAAGDAIHGDTSSNGSAVAGINSAGGVGVWGGSVSGTGVHGTSSQGAGVQASSTSGNAVYGTSQQADAISGVSSSPKYAGIRGTNDSGGNGVYAEAAKADAIVGRGGRNGVMGETASPTDSGVWGNNTAAVQSGVTKYPIGVSGTSNGIGIYGKGGKFAGYFDGEIQANGDIFVTGDVILQNQSAGDCAEDFDVEDSEETITPGTVLVIGDAGKLTVSKDEYDSRIAGVVSGAGNLRPAILLNRINSKQRRMPIALIGKTFCKVDATSAPIKAGDLLTTALTPGHAMKVLDHTRAIDAIVGKALAGLKDGQGLIPILVTPR